MATSGSIDLSATGLDIIKEAYEQLGVIGENGTPSTNQQASAARTLNYMMKAWQAEGVNLWAIQKSVLFLAKDTTGYTINSTGDNWTNSFVKAALAADYAAAATTLDLDTIAGMSSADYVGVELDDGTMQWTTINGAPSGSSIVLTTGLTSAASSGNAVFTYTTKANRPMKILRANRVTYDEREIPLEHYTRDEFIRLPDKSDDGPVVAFFYNRIMTDPEFNVWPQSSSVRDRIEVYSQRSLDDIDTVATNEVDFPQEWFLALALNLAVLLEPKYGLPANDKKQLTGLATYYKDLAEGYDREDSVDITPDDNYIEEDY